MSFDKIKAMRSAERFIAQGNIRSAISEFKQVVANDPKDFGTMNMLGDLCVKTSDHREAVNCYTAVAEHYGKQGFAQKAIAVYNKIARLQPDDLGITERLAELYKQKGSITESRTHYLKLADHYNKLGQKAEALNIWKEIAVLDDKNTEVYTFLAKSYLELHEMSEAVAAFNNAGRRFAAGGMHEDAVNAFESALSHSGSDAEALKGFVTAKNALGESESAIDALRSISDRDPHNREVIGLLAGCYIEAGRVAEAEEATIRLVELDPASYPKFLEVAKVYIAQGDVAATMRILTISSEHLLIDGNADDYSSILLQVVEQDPRNIEALRLSAKFYSWQRNENATRESLQKLAEAANAQGVIEDERYALSQLLIMAPHETAFALRLKDINQEYGYESAEFEESLFDKQFLKTAQLAETPAQPELERNGEDVGAVADYSSDFAFADEIGDDAFALPGGGSDYDSVSTAEVLADAPAADDSPEAKLAREVDSIKFYIDNGYLELADKAINELRGEFGECAEVLQLRSHLEAQAALSEKYDEAPMAAMSSANGNGNGNGLYTNGNSVPVSSGFGIDDLRNELGIDEIDGSDDSDYDTHYQMAVAYQEMGLMEESIKEYQEAIGLVLPNDPKRRFFQCANLLGHCFMQQGMPNLALKWYQRALETPNLDDEEKQAIWYELGTAFEAEGDTENAGRYFEQVYAENIDFRDVSERVRSMAIHR
jgi:tetratricopeptide (TPR) repeat protein